MDCRLAFEEHSSASTDSSRDDAVHALSWGGRWLRDRGYRFVTVTPATHARVLARAQQAARSLEDVFGWSRPFEPALLPDAAADALDAAQALDRTGALWRSRVRYSSLEDDLFVHSAYPTLAADAVFFGPDTYRFAAFIRATVRTQRATAKRLRVVDIGCGSGAGGVVALHALGGSATLTLTDINPRALLFARANCALSGIDAGYALGDLYAPLARLGSIDLVVANPPYLADPLKRAYRDGGGGLGSGLSLRIVREGLSVLAQGGQLLLYTGSPIVGGRDGLRDAIETIAREQDCRCVVHEIDPDVFGEELDGPIYANVDRIAVLGAVLTRAPNTRSPH
jgi:methylase of polypeptide subunit release factors